MAIRSYIITDDSGKREAGNKRSYDLTLRCVCDPNDTVFTLSTDSRLPEIMSSHPEDHGAMLKGKTPKRVVGAQTQDSSTWDVTLNYDSEPISSQEKEKDKEPNPIKRKPEIKWSGVTFTRAVDKTVDDPPQAIATVPGEVYDPFLEVDDSRQQVVITRNQASYSASIGYLYTNSVCSEAFAGAPARTAKMQDISADKVDEGDQTYWKVTFTIQFSHDGWRRKVLHQGFMAFVGPLKIPAVLDDGRDSPKPVLLASDGTKLGDDADPYFQEFKVYREISWGPLQLANIF